MKLTIENFQGHEKSEIEFGEGITAIKGNIGKGKSAIFRALSAVVLGKKFFRRRKTTFSKVSLDSISRQYKGGKESWLVGSKLFTAMNRKIPADVTQALKLGELNFKAQHEPYFLLAKTPGERARELNKLVDLSIIDYTRSVLKKEGDSLNIQITAAKNDKESLEKSIEDLSWVEEADNLYSSIESLETKISENTLENKRLSDSLEVILNTAILANNLETGDRLNECLKLLSSISETEKSIDDLKEEIRVVSQQLDFLNSLPTITESEITELLNSISKAPDVVNFAEDVNLVSETLAELRQLPNLEEWRDKCSSLLAIPVEPVDGLATDIRQVVELSSELFDIEGIDSELSECQRLIDKINELPEQDDLKQGLNAVKYENNQIWLLAKEERTLQLEYDQLLKEAGQCPYCGSVYENCKH